MNTTQLECFLSVAFNLNFARAAEEIHITQPAVTHQINSLESELGVKLFRRTTRTVQLTMDGLNFISDAKSIVQSMYHAKARLLSKQGTPFSLLSIGCSTALEYACFPQMLRPLVKKFPDVHPVIKAVPAQALGNLLDNESIDIMFSLKLDTDIKKSWIYHELVSAGVVCALPKDHKYASSSSLTLEELSHEKLVFLEPRKTPAQIFALQALLVSLHSPADLYFCDDMEGSLTMTASGLGVTILPDIKPFKVNGLVYVPLEDETKLSYGLYYKERNKNKMMKYFIELAEQILRD